MSFVSCSSVRSFYDILLNVTYHLGFVFDVQMQNMLTFQEHLIISFIPTTSTTCSAGVTVPCR